MQSLTSKLCATLFACLILPCVFLAADSQANSKDMETKLTRKEQMVIFRARKAMDNDKTQKARDLLKEYLKNNPESTPARIYLLLGNNYHDQGNNSKACKVYAQGVHKFPEHALLNLNLAITSYENNEFAKAGQLFQKTYKLQEEPNTELLYQSAAAFYQAQEYSKARAALQRLLKTEPSPETAWLELLIHTCLQLNDHQKAEQAIRKLLEKQPGKVDYWKLLAQVHLDRDKYQDAATALEIAYSLKSPKASDWKQLANLYLYLKAPLQAARCLEKAAQNQPNAKQCQELAKSYAQADRIERALSYWDKAIQKEPCAEYYLEKGKLLYNVRSYQEAMQAFQECTSLNTEHGLAHLLLAYSAWESQDWQLAREALARAADLPDYREQAQSSLDIINNLLDQKSFFKSTK